MEKEKLNYIEEFGLLFEDFGATRMSGRIFGLLIVTEKEAVSFDEIKEILKASKGSISQNVRSLVTMGFVKAVALPGDRKTYYRVTPIDVTTTLTGRMQKFKLFSDTLKKGKQLKDTDDSVTEWLTEASAFYDWAGEQIEKMVINEWPKIKDKVIAKQKK